MSKRVYVVTCVELGWDCIVGVFSDKLTNKNCVVNLMKKMVM